MVELAFECMNGGEAVQVDDMGEGLLLLTQQDDQGEFRSYGLTRDTLKEMLARTAPRYERQFLEQAKAA